MGAGVDEKIMSIDAEIAERRMCRAFELRWKLLQLAQNQLRTEIF
jgi:hypothetical protein